MAWTRRRSGLGRSLALPGLAAGRGLSLWFTGFATAFCAYLVLRRIAPRG